MLSYQLVIQSDRGLHLQIVQVKGFASLCPSSSLLMDFLVRPPPDYGPYRGPGAGRGRY